MSFLGFNYLFRFWCVPLAVVRLRNGTEQGGIIESREVFVFGLRIAYFTL